MSKPADKPEVVHLPAETPIAAPVTNRRAAAQRVREARDRLTSTSGTRPAFDRELLRQYAQTRLSASYVVMLLVAATGLLFGFLIAPISAAAWTCGMCWITILVHPASPDAASNTLMMFLMLLVIAVSSMLAASLPVAALAATVP